MQNHPTKRPNILLLAVEKGAERLDSYGLMVATRDILGVIHDNAQTELLDGVLGRMKPGSISALSAMLTEGAENEFERSAPQIDTELLFAEIDMAELQELAANILDRRFGEGENTSRFAHTLGAEACEALNSQISDWQTRFQIDDDMAP